MKRQFKWRFLVLVGGCLLAMAAAVRAGTVPGSAWGGTHWTLGGSTLSTWYTQSWAQNMSATESITDVNVVIEHDSDNDGDDEWDEFTNASGPRSSTWSGGFRVGTAVQYSVTGYDNHHHPSVNGSFVRGYERVYIYDSSTSITTPVDGSIYNLACP